MLKQMMDTIMLTCELATKKIAVKHYRSLSFVERLQLKLHLLGCQACRKFNKQSDLIDHAIEKLHHEAHKISTSTLNIEVKEKVQSHIDSHVH